ncbi:MAG: replication factor C small subunit [Candidatus Woesearchaeota archaeon]|nr:MAG: replication factor C small subunit [Candidatus Woesearchaeota archaeon]
MTNEKEDSKLWTEKYRPQSFSEVKGQTKIVERLSAFVKKKNVPHMLFAGPAGVGKTTLALIVAKKLFSENRRYNLLELNASDDRGIDVIRNQVKDFARTKAIGDVPFKIIYLDEADSLTREAQQALRRTMESFSQTCRFILSCNYSSKLIDPIQSRCTIFRFKPLDKEAMKVIISGVAKNEDLKVPKETIDLLYEISNGDCRRAENILQSCAAISKNITDKLIYEIISAARPKEIKEILESAVNGDFIKSREVLLETMLNHGLSGMDVINQIQKEIWNLTIDDNKKLDMIEKCGEVEFRMVEGSDEFIQLESLLASFSKK